MLKKVEWPGIATAVGLVVILTLIIVGSHDDFHLKEWQTSIAGLMALVAAGIAYRGATAPIRHHQAQAEVETKRRRLALYMKIEFALRQLAREAGNVDTKFMFSSAFDTTFRQADFFLAEPHELQEAWEYLDLFPRAIIAEIRTVRNSLRQLARIHDRIEGAITVVRGADDPHEISQARLFRADIKTACALVVSELEPIIKELAPPMDENERMYRFYGEPPPYEEDE
jgi:hypothetical protein